MIASSDPRSRTYQPLSSGSEQTVGSHISAIRSESEVGLPSTLSNRDANEGRYQGRPPAPMDMSPFDDIGSYIPEQSTLFVHMDLFNPITEEFYGQSSLGWIFDDLPEVVFPTLPNSPKLGTAAPLPMAIDSELDQATSGFNDGSGTGALERSSSHEDGSGPEDPWPAEWHISTQRLVLPSLGRLDETVPAAHHFVMLPITSSARLRLLDSIRIPLDRGPWQTVSLVNFPSCERLDHCVDLYFVHFNKVCRTTHKLPTPD